MKDGWRNGKKPRDRKLEMMRRAKTAVESTHGLGGLEKRGAHAPRPVTLPKMPWEDEQEAK